MSIRFADGTSQVRMLQSMVEVSSHLASWLNSKLVSFEWWFGSRLMIVLESMSTTHTELSSSAIPSSELSLKIPSQLTTSSNGTV